MWSGVVIDTLAWTFIPPSLPPFVCLFVEIYFFVSSSYLDLLGTFHKLIGVKKSELQNARNRTKTGLDKLLTTADEVVKLQEELESMQPLLTQAKQETVETMEQIKVDTVCSHQK